MRLERERLYGQILRARLVGQLHNFDCGKRMQRCRELERARHRPAGRVLSCSQSRRKGCSARSRPIITFPTLEAAFLPFTANTVKHTASLLSSVRERKFRKLCRYHCYRIRATPAVWRGKQNLVLQSLLTSRTGTSPTPKFVTARPRMTRVRQCSRVSPFPATMSMRQSRSSFARKQTPSVMANRRPMPVGQPIVSSSDTAAYLGAHMREDPWKTSSDRSRERRTNARVCTTRGRERAWDCNLGAR